MPGCKFTYSDNEVKELVLSTYSRLVVYVERTLRCSKEKAEDILQESILKFLKRKADIEASKAEGYLFMVVRNECLNAISRTRQNIRLEDSAWDTLAAIDFSEDEEKPQDIEALLKFAETFNPRTREIFEQSRLEGKTHSEIARALGITERSVENHLKISVEKFRKQFKS